MNPLRASTAVATAGDGHAEGARPVVKDAKDANGAEFETLLHQATFEPDGIAASPHVTSSLERIVGGEPSSKAEPRDATAATPRARSRPQGAGVTLRPHLPAHAAHPGTKPTPVTPAPRVAHGARPVATPSAVLADQHLITTPSRAPATPETPSHPAPRPAPGSSSTAAPPLAHTLEEDQQPSGSNAAGPPEGAAGRAGASRAVGQTGRRAHETAVPLRDAAVVRSAPARAVAQPHDVAGAPSRPAADPAAAAAPAPTAAPAPAPRPTPTAAPAPAARPAPAPGPALAPGANPEPSQSLPGVAGQLVRVLSAPRQVADGGFTVTVALHPSSLGTVRATVVAGPDRVSVQLAPTTAEGADALRIALPDLKSALSSSGQQVQVTLSESSAPASGGLASGPQGGGGGHLPATSRQRHSASPSTPRSPSQTAPEPPRTAPPRTAAPAPSSHLVDIRI